MSVNEKITSCAPEDCSTCSADCGSRLDLSQRFIDLTTDSGESIRCIILIKYVMEEKDYIAVMPIRNNPDKDVYLFRLVKDGSGLENIDDEDEYDRAAEVFGREMAKAEAARK